MGFNEVRGPAELTRLPRIWSLVAVSWLCVLLLASCSPSEKDGRVVIDYMAWGNPQQLEVEEMLIERFNQRNPHIEVRLFKVPQSAYANKMIIMLATDTAPDLMRVDHYNFPALVEREYFHPLCDLVAADPDFRFEDFFPQAIQEGMYQGRFYGVNVLFGGIILYYNKTLVEKHGLEDPFELWERGEWTWDRFREHAIAMTTKRPDGRYATFGASMPASVIYPALVWSFGGEIMDSTRTQVLLGEGRGRDMFQFFVDLRYKYHAAPTPAQAANAAFSFESGKLGMEFGWMGMTPRYREAASHFDWDVVPLPTGAGGVGNVVKGNQLVMNAKTEHPQEAWEFMKFMVSEEVERILSVDLRRAFPSRKSVAYSEEYLQSELPPFNMRTFIFTVETGRPYPITDRWWSWLNAFHSGIENLFNGRDHDVDRALAEATRRAEEALAVPEGL